MSKIKKALDKAKVERESDGVEPDVNKEFLLNLYQKGRRGFSSRSKQRTNTLILVGTVIFVFAILFTLKYTIEQKASKDELALIQAKLSNSEIKSSMLFKGIEEINTALKRQEQLIQDYLSKDESLKEQLNGLTQEVCQLRKNNRSVNLTDNPSYAKMEMAPSSKNRYHEVCLGETLYRIGKRYSISVDALRRLNNLSPSQSIYPGQKLLVTSGN